MTVSADEYRSALRRHPAGVAGVVTEILAENGQLVEHGQALIRVQPA